MTFETFQQLAQHATTNRRLAIPVYRRLGADLLTPVGAFLKLRERGKPSFLFESVEGGEKIARYSFLGVDPYKTVQSHANDAAATERDGNVRDGDIFAPLERELSKIEEVEIPGLPRFTGGAVGYVGYDAIRTIEFLPDTPDDDLELPDSVWCLYKTIVAFDHVKHQVIILSTAFLDDVSEAPARFAEAQRDIERVEERLRRPEVHLPEPIKLSSEELTSNFEAETFREAVRTAKHHIVEGDIFQVVLSQRFEMGYTGDAFNLYRALRQVSPSPYLFFLSLGDFALAGSSPELLVRVEGHEAETMPIAGTRPRSTDVEKDIALEKELLADPKERAEHLMLVDLGRNDLSRVCVPGSVGVDRYAEVERFSHVMHIVSSVSGQLAGDRTSIDALRSCFPAGTVSGAPKVRAMQIIDELEPTKRGVYAGAVGYIDFAGNLDTCIAIRTMVVRGGKIYIQAGAGIVADSDPLREYEETRNKAAALREAMQVAANDLL